MQIYSQLQEQASVSLRFRGVPGIGGEVALEGLPAFVVVLIQASTGLESPLGDCQTQGRFKHECLQEIRQRRKERSGDDKACLIRCIEKVWVD